MGPKKAKKPVMPANLSQKSDNTSLEASQDVDMISLEDLMEQRKQRVCTLDGNQRRSSPSRN